MEPVVLIVNLKLKCGRESEFAQELRDILEQVRREPACVSITGHQNPDDPTSFMLIEVWRSREEFDEFETGRPYLQDYMRRVTPMWSQPREMLFYQIVA